MIGNRISFVLYHAAVDPVRCDHFCGCEGQWLSIVTASLDAHCAKKFWTKLLSIDICFLIPDFTNGDVPVTTYEPSRKTAAAYNLSAGRGDCGFLGQPLAECVVAN